MGDATSLPARFWAKVNKNGPVSDFRPDLGPCWTWTGGISVYGYVHVAIDRRRVYGHRVCYEDQVGPIPAGLFIDHLCRVRHCVNPRHLEPVTTAENNRRGMSFIPKLADKTHCPKGHPYDAANTWSSPSGKVGRQCRACHRERQAERQRRISAATPGKGHRNGRKTHCDQGHPFDEHNTVYYQLGRRTCRACVNVRAAARRERIRSGQKTA